MIIAVASLTIIVVLIYFPLALVLMPTLGNFAGYEISAVIVFLVSPIIAGYIFSQKIWEENRTKTIAKITVLFTVLVTVIVLVENAAVEWAPMFKAEYLKVYPTATPSAFDWYYIELLELLAEQFVLVVLILALTFIGLYIGTMLKKPAKS